MPTDLVGIRVGPPAAKCNYFGQQFISPREGSVRHADEPLGGSILRPSYRRGARFCRLRTARGHDRPAWAPLRNV